MGFVSVLASIIAYVLFYGTGHIILLPLSILAIVGCLWSWGIMHNYATNQARKRDSYRDGDEASQMVQYLRRNNPMANQPSPENRIQCNMVRNRVRASNHTEIERSVADNSTLFGVT